MIVIALDDIEKMAKLMAQLNADVKRRRAGAKKALSDFKIQRISIVGQTRAHATSVAIWKDKQERINVREKNDRTKDRKMEYVIYPISS